MYPHTSFMLVFGLFFRLIGLVCFTVALALRLIILVVVPLAGLTLLLLGLGLARLVPADQPRRRAGVLGAVLLLVIAGWCTLTWLARLCTMIGYATSPRVRRIRW